ncbi:DNA glycosylase [Xylariaceae sp. FL0804]|nr:DNA glycosylase [Xylariaceae sp. FL0804]
MPRKGRKTAAVPIKGGWDVLPHNMGTLPNTTTTTTTTATPAEAVPNTLPALAPGSDIIEGPRLNAPVTQETSATNAPAPSEADGASRRELRSRKPKVQAEVNKQSTTRAKLQVEAEDDNPIKAELRTEDNNESLTQLLASSPTVPKKRKRQSRKAAQLAIEGQDAEEPSPKKPKRKARITKDNPYGLTPGESPFADWPDPSPEQCEEVHRLLAEMHDDASWYKAPETIPAPSLEVAGCGEVPDVLDALIRTLLSGATTFDGADKMIQGLQKKFGILEEGIGKGSINWNKVRLSPIEDVVDAIRIGGLAQIKAKHIKGILDMVHQENMERREAYIAEKETGVQAEVYGAAEKTKGQKDFEIMKTEKSILSLDHMRGLSVNELMKQFTKFPGIGVKTSACVILFCLQLPCFAVDTHVAKFSKWLGWAPEKANENSIFSHLEVRCPDHLKYGLHQLFIRHGKVCMKCMRSTAEGTKEWKAAKECPLEHLLNRFDKRQTKAKPKVPKRKKGIKEEDAQEQEDIEDLEDLEDAALGGEASFSSEEAPALEEEVKQDLEDMAEAATGDLAMGEDGDAAD